MFTNFTQFIRSYQPHEIFLEMAVIWIVVYLVFRFLQGTRGAGVIKGFTLLLVILTGTIWALSQISDAFSRITHIYYSWFMPLLAVLLIVVFQPELRQAMIQLGQTRFFRSTRSDLDRVVSAVNEAVTFLSKSQFGALIAIERSVKLGGMVEGGQSIDAEVSARLLESIFWPNSPLHDLGVVIRDDRIVAAGVQFPLIEEGSLPPEFGSRHRAAAGLTLESDSIVIIVSEETGAVSIAERGKIQYDIPRDQLETALHERLQTNPQIEEKAKSATAPAETESPDVKAAADEKAAA